MSNVKLQILGFFRRLYCLQQRQTPLTEPPALADDEKDGVTVVMCEQKVDRAQRRL